VNFVKIFDVDIIKIKFSVTAN